VSLLSRGRIVEHGALEDVAGELDGQLARALLPLPPSVPLPGPLQRGPVLEIVFSGDSAKEPVLTGVARHFDMDINVLAGSVETLGGQQFGHLRVQLADDSDVDGVLGYLHDRGINARRVAPAAAAPEFPDEIPDEFAGPVVPEEPLPGQVLLPTKEQGGNR
jgi:D-methionine transport system ATP-binding protein